MAIRVRDFPETIASVVVDGSTRRVVGVLVPDYLVDHPTRVVTLMIKNRTDVDVYLKCKDYPDASALRITAKEYEAIEYTPIQHYTDIEVWSLSAPTNSETVEIVREG